MGGAAILYGGRSLQVLDGRQAKKAGKHRWGPMLDPIWRKPGMMQERVDPETGTKARGGVQAPVKDLEADRTTVSNQKQKPGQIKRSHTKRHRPTSKGKKQETVSRTEI